MVLLLFWALGCGGGAEDGDAGGEGDAGRDSGVETDSAVGDDGAAGLTLADVFISENPDNVLSYFVDWTTSAPASTELQVTCADDYDETFRDEERVSEHSVFVMGLYANADCTFALRSVAEDGSVGVAEEAVAVAGLPDFLPGGFSIEAIDAEAMQPGWTLGNFHNHSQGGQLSAGLLDPQGRFRWYARLGTERYGTVVQEVSAHPEGVLVGSHGEIQPAIHGWDGDIVWSRPLPSSHHDVRRHPDADHLTYLTRGMPCGPSGHAAGGVDRMNVHTGEIVWSWDICGHFEPPDWFYDWAHINTYEPVPEDGSFLLSLRNVSAILAVDEASGDLLWHLGEGGDFTLESGEWFFLQHAVERQPGGNLLLYDNGLEERGYSRAVELALDESTMTARIVWEWAPEDRSGSWWTRIWGDADRLRNGNTLINFSQTLRDEAARLVEVNAAGEVVWHLKYANVWASYRADRVDVPSLIRLVEDLPTEL